MKQELKKSEDQALESALNKARSVLLNSSGDVTPTLPELEKSLAEHEASLKMAGAKCSRIDASLRRVIESGSLRCLASDARDLASSVIAGVDLSKVVSEDRRALEKTVYARMQIGDSRLDIQDDVRLMKQWDWERGAILVLQEAIRLRKQSIAALRKPAILLFCRMIGEARGALARKFLAAVKEAQELMEQESQIAETLKPDELALVQPKPFPAKVVSNEVVEWLLAAVNQQLIRPDDLAGLHLGAR